MKLSVYSQPSTEPITIGELKTHLRITGSDDDTYLDTVVSSARMWTEMFVRRALVNTTFDLWLDSIEVTEKIILPRPPLVSVTHVKWYTDDDTATTVDTATYHVDTNGDNPGVVLVRGATWPSSSDLRSTNGLNVRFVAGYGTADDVPDAIKSGIKEWARGLYDSDPDAIMAAKGLLRPFRVVML